MPFPGRLSWMLGLFWALAFTSGAHAQTALFHRHSNILGAGPDNLVPNADFTLVWGFQTHNAPQQCGFAAAAGS